MTQDWRKIYAGREAELKALIASWEKVKSGGGPHVHIVRGERGMGKTRLVQEFYYHIATHDDPDNYWPDSISTDGNVLLPGPDPDIDPKVKAHFDSFTLKDRIMPFLWWGFRIADPQQRNINTTKLEQHASTLVKHMVPLVLAREMAILKYKSARGLITGTIEEGGTDIASDIIEGLLQEIPGASTLSTIYGVGKRVNSVRKDYKEKTKSNEVKQNASLSSLFNVAGRDIQDSTLDQLKLLSPQKSSKSDSIKAAFGKTPPDAVPAILFIDDAQFAGLSSGSGSLALLTRFWHYARMHNLPVLIIATHWNYDWDVGLGISPAEDPEKPASFVQAFQPRSEKDNPRFSETVLGREVDLGGILASALPQLSEEDKALILSKADGNPMLLREILERLTDKELSWCDKDGLTALGQRQLKNKTFKLHELLKERLETTTPLPIRKAVLMSALQGVEFIESVTLKAAEHLNMDIGSDALRLANSPHAFIDFLDADKAAFIQRAVYDAALTLVDDVFEDKAEIQAALQIATEILLANANENAAIDDTAQQEQIKQLRGMNIGNGLESDDPAIFDKALVDLESEILSYTEGLGREVDYSAASEFAQTWWLAVKSKTNLSVNPFRYNIVVASLRANRGIEDVVEISEHALKSAQNRKVEGDIAHALSQLAQIKILNGLHEDALKLLEQAKEIRSNMFEKNPDNISRRNLSVVTSRLGTAYHSLGNLEFALKYYGEALEHDKALMSELNTEESILDLSASIASCANVEFKKRNYFDALESAHQSLILLRQYVERSKKSIHSQEKLTGILHLIATIEIHNGNYLVAKKYLIEERKIYKEIAEIKDTPGAWHNLCIPETSLGDVERNLSNFDIAREHYHEAKKLIEIANNAWGGRNANKDLALVYGRLAKLESNVGNYVKARKYFSNSVKGFQNVVLRQDNFDINYKLMRELNSFAEFECSQNDHQTAFQLFQKTIEVGNQFLSHTYNLNILLETSYAMNRASIIQLNRNKFSAARDLALQEIDLRLKSIHNNEASELKRDLALAYQLLGDCEIRLRNRKKARASFLEAFDMMNNLRHQTNLPQDHRLTSVFIIKKVKALPIWSWGLIRWFLIVRNSIKYNINEDLAHSLKSYGFTNSTSDVISYMRSGKLPPKVDKP